MNIALATAFGSTSIRYDGPAWPLAGTVFDILSRVPAELKATPAASAPWLTVVESRIVGSIEPEDSGLADGSGAWLRRDIAERAIAFFRCASDILPMEPHIYSSTCGDLVAEFELAVGNRLTTIVGAERVWAYAVASGETFKQTVETPNKDYRAARAAVVSLVGHLAIA